MDDLTIEDGIFKLSLYLAIVLLEIIMPLLKNSSTNFWSLYIILLFFSALIIFLSLNFIDKDEILFLEEDFLIFELKPLS